tara:strand:+ start:244 stop:465 length:222 start_codon:yes stop_codon:yes gene_type:complete
MAHADIDPHSKTWHVVQALVIETIGADQAELERASIPERAADVLRGRIEFARAILALTDDDEEPEIHDAAHIV